MCVGVEMTLINHILAVENNPISIMVRKLNDALSVDCVILGFDGKDLNVLLIDRRFYNGDTLLWADKSLTGNHIYEDEDIDVAASRILIDWIGINNIYLEQFHTFGAPDRVNRPNDRQWIAASGRNPDIRIISVGYVALLPTMQLDSNLKLHENVRWYNIDLATNLAFDHDLILDTALKYVRHKIELDPSAGFALLPEKFTLTQLQNMYESVFKRSYDKRNFRRKAMKVGYIEALDEWQEGRTNKPAQLYQFNQDKYDMLQKNGRLSSIF